MSYHDEFTRLFGAHLAERHVPRIATFGRPNFMTPDLLGYVTAPDGRLVEVSCGEFLDRPLFGVTFPRVGPLDDGVPSYPGDGSRSCDSLVEAFEYLFPKEATR